MTQSRRRFSAQEKVALLRRHLKEFVRIAGMTHVRIRPCTPLSLEEARCHNEPKDLLTPGKEMPMMKPAGETEAGSPEPVEGWRATRQG